MSNEKEQTAVEWLIQKLINRQNGVFDGFPYLSVDEIYDKAKEMEKEQIENAFEESRLTYPMIGFKHQTFEQYYKETYGTNKWNNA